MLETSKSQNPLGHDRGSGALKPVLMFMTGVAVGGAAAALLTPHAGRDLRRQLRSGMRRWSDRARARSARTDGQEAQEPTQGPIEPAPTVHVEADVAALGPQAEPLSGDLPGSVGGLSGGALGETTSEEPTRRET